MPPGSEDPRRRNKVLKAAGRAWMKSDPAAAKAWLEGPGVPREVREAVLNPPRRVANRPAPKRAKSAD